MSNRAIGASYAQSLLWIALFIVLAGAATLVVEFVVVDLIHGNSKPPFDGLMSMMMIFPPALASVAAIVALLVCGLPQLFQASAICISRRPLGDLARFVVLLALPITAAITWYCYDHLTPSGFNLGIIVRRPFEHGISLEHYLAALLFQAPVTLFSFFYFEFGFRGRSRWPLVLIALVIMIAIGAALGYDDAMAQIELQKNSPPN